jgi:hypothetical protein
MPVIPATQEAEIRRIVVQSHPGQIVYRTLSLGRPFTKQKEKKNRASVLWLKVKALSSSPCTTKEKKKGRDWFEICLRCRIQE